jgi:transposase InsO family protein
MIVGFGILANHSTTLVVNALLATLQYNARAVIFISDNGSEYDSKTFIALLTEIGTHISRSYPGCPWENGYQESFYSQFKVDLGDPNRFENLGGLVCEIYRTIYTYNHSRIHTALKMSPVEFAEMQKTVRIKDVELVS